MATEKAAVAASCSVRAILKRLRRHRIYTHDLHDEVQKLIQHAAEAGERLAAGQARDVAVWTKRAVNTTPEATSPLHRQATRRHWIQKGYIRCHARKGQDCLLRTDPNAGAPRRVPHEERLQPIIEARKAKQKQIPHP